MAIIGRELRPAGRCFLQLLGERLFAPALSPAPDHDGFGAIETF
jgi:hypothetical protein